MNLVSLRHLHAFNAVAASGGIRRSSETLYRASSAVARSVAALEESLEAQLFERKGRGMLLTAAGDVVRLRADRIEAELHHVREEAVRLRERNLGKDGKAGGKVGGIEALLNERRLQAAVLLAEVHHMPTVAHTMGTSQSAVSQAIARLEDMLAHPLFLRTAHGMVPTDAGRRWVESFERVLSELSHIPEDIAALAGVVRGSVTIGALPLARSQLLPQAIASVLEKHPQLRVRSLESPFEELTAGLLSGRIDFIVGALRLSAGEGFEMRPLIGDEAVLVVRAGHPLAGRPAVTLAEACAYPWVLSRAGTPLREALEQFFQERGVPAPEPAVETGDLALLRGLLVCSDMLTVLSAHQLHYEIATGQLAVLPFSMPGMGRSIGVTTRKGAHLSPGANALLAEMDALAKQWPNK